jgi:hypothetical protein
MERITRLNRAMTNEVWIDLPPPFETRLRRSSG